ncbi:MAG TPA: carbon-nitrogen hydrolase family protein [Ktedonobacterales bacterium]|jgi:nitrilase|nr:carbon-nitrogen hydrolase family protein [Ktedonobacterales bacterium]
MGRIAAIQTPPVYLDAMATAQHAAVRIAEAAEAGAWLAVLPESFIPGYPDWVWRVPPRSSSPSAEPFHTLQRRFVANAITVPGPETDVIAAACRAHQMMVAVGVSERPARAGTLYNTLLYFGPDGAILGRHRKLVPTFAERLVWGQGDGTTLRTIQTAHGIVGGLICWENYMPLARTTLYAQGEQIHVAPTQDDGERWLATVRHIAVEGRMWVVSVGSFMREGDLPRDLAALGVYEPGSIINPGDSVIVDPLGHIVAGPAHDRDTILYADADPAEAVLARAGFDAVGHYGRADVFDMTVNGVAIPLEIGDGVPMAAMAEHTWQVAAATPAGDRNTRHVSEGTKEG